MIIAVDCETKGLDATKFVCGCIVKESMNNEFFTDKNELWNRVLDMGERLVKQRKVLNVYMHNAHFDFSAFANLKDENLVFVSLKPFIVEYRIDGKKAICFLDTMNIFRMSLKRLGDMVGLPKIEMPDELLSGRIKRNKLEKIRFYNVRDAEILIKAVLMLKEKLKEDGISLKRIYTISQIAINYFMNWLSKREEYSKLFMNEKKTILHYTKHKELIHNSYRAGRTETFRTGKVNKIKYLDVNNLYGYASVNIPFADLRTESRLFKPLEYMDKDDLLNKIGVSKCIIRNESNELGCLQVTVKIENDFTTYVPKSKKTIYGVFTHLEIKHALNNGYKLLHIEESVIYNECKNPFKELTPYLFAKRESENDPFNKWLYKQLQNCSYGKLAQKSEKSEIIVRNIEDTQELYEQGYEAWNRQGEIMFMKKKSWARPKRHYAPIIASYINAYSRCFMHDEMKKYNIKNLVYTDTDSIIFVNEEIKNSVGNELGKFKIENKGDSIEIFGRKSYIIDDKLTFAGITLKNVTKEELDKGIIRNRKMIKLSSRSNLNNVGKFYNENRDLNEQVDKHIEKMCVLENLNTYKDKSINDNEFVSMSRVLRT